MSKPYGSPAGRSGRWFRRGGNIVIDLGGRAPSGEGELQEEISEEVGSPNAVIDPRIDVHAQFAILRMSKNPATAGAAAAMLAAVKGGQLGGIYKEDQLVPAQMAQRNGLGWWEILPRAGADAALVFEGSNPPLLLFRDSVRSQPARLDPALIRAFGGSPTVLLLPPAVIASTLRSIGLSLSPAEVSALASGKRVSLASRPEDFKRALANARSRFGGATAPVDTRRRPRRPCGNCRGFCFPIATRTCLCFGGGSFISFCRVFDLPRPFP